MYKIAVFPVWLIGDTMSISFGKANYCINIRGHLMSNIILFKEDTKFV